MSKTHLKLILITAVVAIVGLFLLRFVGQLLIQEVIQEVVIEKPAAPMAVTVGKRAPHWELSDRAGRSTAISDFLGTPLVIVFWSTWNTAAADQVTVLDRFLSESETLPFELVTINNQEERAFVAQFLKRGAYRIPVFFDESGAVGELYAIQTLPTTFFIDAEGIVHDVFIGPIDAALLLELVEAAVR